MGTVWADRTETNPGEIGGQVHWEDRGLEERICGGRRTRTLQDRGTSVLWHVGGRIYGGNTWMKEAWPVGKVWAGRDEISLGKTGA
jgi:hypothetical protein